MSSTQSPLATLTPIDELLASAHELVHPAETLWIIDCKLKKSVKTLEDIVYINRALRFILSYPLVHRPLFTLDRIITNMNTRNRLEPATERELVRLYPSLVETHGLSAVTNDAVTNDAVTNDAVTNDAVTNDAVTNEAVTNEAVTNEAVTNEAVTNENLWTYDIVLPTAMNTPGQIEYLNRSLRDVLRYNSAERRPLFTLNKVIADMQSHKCIEPATERELVRLYPSLVETHGLSALNENNLNEVTTTENVTSVVAE